MAFKLNKINLIVFCCETKKLSKSEEELNAKLCKGAKVKKIIIEKMENVLLRSFFIS